MECTGAATERCADWIRRKAEIRSVKDDLLHGKMYHVQGARADALIGSSNFTLPGLGLHERKNVELNLVVDSDRDRNDLLAWFEEWWSDTNRTEDVKDRVLRELELLHRSHSPAFIYHLTLFHLFGDELADLAGTDEDVDRRGLGRTEIWRSLFDFQREAAKIVIDRVNRLNGCILADSVGLGKTYTALAVIKYFELQNERVLVLCPKKLMRNWKSLKANSTVNPFTEDRFSYDVLFHTDLSRSSGWSGDQDLATVNWGNYHLVVIDESHNFRNAGRESPGHTVVVAAVIHGLTRIRGTGQRKVKAIREYELRKMLACCDQRSRSGFYRVVATRDAALLAIGFAGALRRSEICQLNVDDVDFLGQPGQDNGLFLTIRKSKTDQTAKGQRIAIPAGKGLNAVVRLRRWMALAETQEGPLFQSLWRGGRLRGRRLHHSDIPRLVKHYVEAIGLDPAEYSGHSLRAGFVTSAAVHGARLDKIMEVTRHSSAEMVLRYIRQVEAFDDHAGAAFL